MNDWGVLATAVLLGLLTAGSGYLAESAERNQRKPSRVVRVLAWLLVTIGLGMIASVVTVLLIAALLAIGVIS